MKAIQYWSMLQSQKEPWQKTRDKLDKAFSEFIRLRDTDEHGFGPCVTCGKTVEWNGADCGHFVPRDNFRVRWDSRNAHLQCHQCNRVEHGRQYEMGLYIDKKFGEGMAKQLIGMKGKGYKEAQFDWGALLKEIRSKVKILKKGIRHGDCWTTARMYDKAAMAAKEGR